MELCKNGDLSNYISVQGALEESSSCRLFKQLCTALRYLHNMDVAHRDLKCENLLLDMHNNIKVCDFGSYVDGQMVLSETYCGTAAYAAPEILKRLPYNPKVSDVWSMGVVLYMMLYASLPFNDSNITRMVKEQMEHCINFPEIPPVSSEAKALIHRILHSVVENPLAESWLCAACSACVSAAASDVTDADEATATHNTSLKSDPFFEGLVHLRNQAIQLNKKSHSCQIMHSEQVRK
uniref:non-specific serine/threonine protein kinase n=1 Tax=Acanthochromis polyacanthus TaxID=80966 RepID=A0A3Q1H9H6_9TELE